MNLAIKKVTEQNRKMALDYLYGSDRFLNAYAINRLQNKVLGKVETYAATDNANSKIKGYLSAFEGLGSAVDIWIRGQSLEVEQQLLDYYYTGFYLTDEKRRLFISSNTRMSDTIRARFPTSRIDLQLVMLVRKGEEKISSPDNKVVTIHEEQAEEWTRFVLPEGWELTKEILETNRRFLKEYTAFGIMDSNGRIVSGADSFVKLPHVTVISGVETHRTHRKTGYGTAVVSAALRDALSCSQSAMLFVNYDNYDAIRIYKRLGFREIGKSICAEII